MGFNEKEIQAIQETIRHWERDISASLSLGLHVHVGRGGELRWESGGQVRCYANSCALCKMCCTDEGEIDCVKCPYFKCYGISCNDRTSAWFAFVTEPTLVSCDRMIASLKALLSNSDNKGRILHI